MKKNIPSPYRSAMRGTMRKQTLREDDEPTEQSGEELEKLKWMTKYKLMPALEKLSDVYEDMKWIDPDNLDKWDLPDEDDLSESGKKQGRRGKREKKHPMSLKHMVKEIRTQTRKRLTEDIYNELGDDYKEVRPTGNLYWRSYLARGRRPYYPKNTIALIWNYQVTDAAKKRKEQELQLKYPDRTILWLDLPLVTMASIE